MDYKDGDQYRVIAHAENIPHFGAIVTIEGDQPETAVTVAVCYHSLVYNCYPDEIEPVICNVEALYEMKELRIEGEWLRSESEMYLDVLRRIVDGTLAADQIKAEAAQVINACSPEVTGRPRR